MGGKPDGIDPNQKKNELSLLQGKHIEAKKQYQKKDSVWIQMYCGDCENNSY